MSEDVAHKFWEEWEESIDRSGFIQKKLVNGSLKKFQQKELPKKVGDHAFALLLNSYFEDLLEYATERQLRPSKKKS